jgi:Icc-related predicted phosphoesterase
VTVAAVKELIGWMRDRKMDFLIANGDLGSNEFELEATFGLLAEAGVLVLTHAGNTESCGSFNNVADATFRKKKTVLNGNWVRRLDLDGATFLTMPGYYDRRFAHTQGFARYKPEHVDLLGDMAKDAPKPLVLVSHGPPKMKGKNGIDVATDAGHVGDDAMAELIKRRAIPFGIFGHILEAGGRATDARGDATLGPGKWHPALFVNAGTANPDPWAMLDGSTSYGMGMFVEIEKGKARYEIKRLPQPE